MLVDADRYCEGLAVAQTEDQELATLDSILSARAGLLDKTPTQPELGAYVMTLFLVSFDQVCPEVETKSYELRAGRSNTGETRHPQENWEVIRPSFQANSGFADFPVERALPIAQSWCDALRPGITVDEFRTVMLDSVNSVCATAPDNDKDLLFNAISALMSAVCTPEQETVLERLSAND